jgi:hypothetical protein
MAELPRVHDVSCYPDVRDLDAVADAHGHASDRVLDHPGL